MEMILYYNISYPQTTSAIRLKTEDQTILIWREGIRYLDNLLLHTKSESQQESFDSVVNKSGRDTLCTAVWAYTLQMGG